jgi:hypothetical protein
MNGQCRYYDHIPTDERLLKLCLNYYHESFQVVSHVQHGNRQLLRALNALPWPADSYNRKQLKYINDLISGEAPPKYLNDAYMMIGHGNIKGGYDYLIEHDYSPLRIMWRIWNPTSSWIDEAMRHHRYSEVRDWLTENEACYHHIEGIFTANWPEHRIEEMLAITPQTSPALWCLSEAQLERVWWYRRCGWMSRLNFTYQIHALWEYGYVEKIWALLKHQPELYVEVLNYVCRPRHHVRTHNETLMNAAADELFVFCMRMQYASPVLWCIIMLYADGHLTLRGSITPIQRRPMYRFMSIVEQLPIEVQSLVACAVYGDEMRAMTSVDLIENLWLVM